MAVRAVGLGAMRVQAERVVGQREASCLGHGGLALLDLGVVEFLHLAAVQAHQVVVMLVLAQLVDRLAGLEVVAAQQAGLLELGEHAVHRGQTDVRMLGQQQAVDVLGRHVALLGLLEDLQDLQARQRGLEAGALEFVDVGVHAG